MIENWSLAIITVIILIHVFSLITVLYCFYKEKNKIEQRINILQFVTGKISDSIKLNTKDSNNAVLNEKMFKVLNTLISSYIGYDISELGAELIEDEGITSDEFVKMLDEVNYMKLANKLKEKYAMPAKWKDIFL